MDSIKNILGVCEKCNHKVRAKVSLEGKRVKCPNCGTPVRLRASSKSSEPRKKQIENELQREGVIEKEAQRGTQESLSRNSRQHGAASRVQDERTPLANHQTKLVWGLASALVLVTLVFSIVLYKITSSKSNDPADIAHNSSTASSEEIKNISEETPSGELNRATPPNPGSAGRDGDPMSSEQNIAASENPELPNKRHKTGLQRNDSTAEAIVTSDESPAIGKNLLMSNGDLPALIRLIEPSIARVTTEDTIGSGFVVEGGLIVTNRHVIEGANTAEVTFKNGTSHNVTGVMFDGRDLDLCILKCDGLDASSSKPLQLAESSLQQGAKVFTFGAPQGLSFSVSDGIVSANRWIDDVAYVQTTSPISKGNSGGPLISVANGAVVGVNTFVYTKGQNLNFAIAATHVRKALSNLAKAPVALPIEKVDSQNALEDEAKQASFAQILKKVWEELVQERCDVLTETVSQLDSVRKATNSKAGKVALSIAIEELQHQIRSAGSEIELDVPKISLSAQYGQLEFGTFGYIQDSMEVLQVLNEWNLLLYVDGHVFLLEDFPTKSITTDVTLTARDTVVYVSGTYEYQTKGGEDKTVFRLRPVWDLKEMSSSVIEKQLAIAKESLETRNKKVKALLTRDWKGEEFSGKAEFVKFFGIGGQFTVRLRNEKGGEFDVPFEGLTEADQKWVEEYRAWSKKLFN